MSVSFGIEVITLVPELWPLMLSPGYGLVGKAFSNDRANLRIRNLRDYGKGVHQQVDDSPFGGGAGMVLAAPPLHAAIADAKKNTPGPVILLSPRGVPLRQNYVRELAGGAGFTVICGRYEGVDERIRKYIDADVSIGDFVLSAGDAAALCLIDAVVRLLPGVLGNPASLAEESFSHGNLEYPHYTRPVDYDGATVPDVLRSGDHAAIARWRAEQAALLTAQLRPDLVK